MDEKWSDKDKLAQVFGIHDSEEVDVFTAWTKETANSIASREGISLTDQHWKVIHFLRVMFENVGGNMPPVHELSQMLEERFSDEGGLKHLFSLFPAGPLNQGCRIAGVPVPDDALDTSFGSVH